MQSTEQNLELVVVDHLDGILLIAVSFRVARQQGKDVDSRVTVRSKMCGDKETVSAISCSTAGWWIFTAFCKLMGTLDGKH